MANVFVMKNYHFDYTHYVEQLVPLLVELEKTEQLSSRKLSQLLKRYPKSDSEIFSKDNLVQAYRELAGSFGLQEFQEEVIRKIQMKPTRTISGVTPVTVLTKPFPCPGKCIFCPNDIRMPKSYLADEPGAQRAERNSFDPYLQTYNRLQAFHNTGHHTDKVELIVLGGTWSYYPESYQIWFIKECFRALNDFSEGLDDREQIEARYSQLRVELSKIQTHRHPAHGYIPGNNPQENKEEMGLDLIHGDKLEKTYNQVVSDLYTAPEKLGGFDQYQMASWSDLEVQQQRNETARCRNVGLVIETRPDNISEAEVLRIRRLGCTKTQIGFQSLNDEVLSKNNRGHDVAATRRAVNLLRQAGFKIHAHWMPNLYGSSVEKDKEDYLTLFSDPDFKPDELKIYPCSLIESAELMQYYQKGLWKPYSEPELLDILTFCLMNTPPYCRLTRVIRDIPSTDIVAGNKKTNFRQIAEQKLHEMGKKSQDIRSREVRGQKIEVDKLQLNEVHYTTSVSKEVFLQYILPGQSQDENNKIVGFLRLSLPTVPNFISELSHAAIIREVHVYGQVVGLGEKSAGKAQHLGVGTQLIEHAKKLASREGFSALAVISAIGTKEYYRKRGFVDKKLYQVAHF
jgi:elongator complex protein 3